MILFLSIDITIKLLKVTSWYQATGRLRYQGLRAAPGCQAPGVPGRIAARHQGDFTREQLQKQPGKKKPGVLVLVLISLYTVLSHASSLLDIYEVKGIVTIPLQHLKSVRSSHRTLQ